MKMFLCVFVALASQQLAPAQAPLTGQAAELFKLAQGGKFYATADALKPDYFPTSDSKSFVAVWRATGSTAPKHWIVSLHGTRGFATDDLALWSKHLAKRDVGIVCLQWWFGQDTEGGAYYLPLQINREIDFALQKLGVRPPTVLFHGFSRGSANSYAVAALDAGRGKQYFAINVASSGGVALDFPATRALLSGSFGDRPLRGTRWITCAGGLDKNPERDGIPAMRKTAEWLTEQGAAVKLSIEDPDFGHGAFKLNPKNTERVLDLFLSGGK